MLLFEFAEQLYGYVVCHFQPRISAYWWQRLGTLLLRLAQSLLAQQPHKPWLYVDDLLAALLRSSGDLQLALLVVLSVCLKSPMAARGDSLTWCGWKFNFRSETVSLEPDKLAKLADQIQALLSSKKVNKKALQSCLGLLNWATSISHHLMSYTAPLYSDLNSPPGTPCQPGQQSRGRQDHSWPTHCSLRASHRSELPVRCRRRGRRGHSRDRGLVVRQGRTALVL